MNDQERAAQLAAKLEASAARRVPATLNLWPGILARHNPSAVRRPAWVARALLGVALLLGVGLLAWAVSSGDSTPLTATLPYDPAAPPPPVRQTLHGYTATLQPLYADANRIAVRLTITNPQGGTSLRPYIPITTSAGVQLATLTDAGDGHIYPALDTLGQIYGGQTPEEAGSLLTFDPQSIPADQRAVRLHLALPLRAMTEAPPGTAHQYAYESGDQLPPLAAPVDLPFTFEFTVPVDPWRRTALVGQTVTQAGVAATLERLVITRRETRAFFHFAAQDGTRVGRWLPYMDWPMSAAQSVDVVRPSVSVRPPIPGSEGQPDQVSWSVYPAQPLEQTAWSLTISEVHRYDRAYQELPTLSGPWTFQFTVPPAPSP